MAQEYGFFYSTETDVRAYGADDFANYFNKFISSGVAAINGNELQVLASGNSMDVTVQPGMAFLNGYWFRITEDAETVTIERNTATTPRIARVILQLNIPSRITTIEVLYGTNSASPVGPALTRNASIYQIALADILQGSSDVAVTQAQITDQRANGPSQDDLCGYITWRFETTTLDINSFIAEFQARLDAASANFEASFQTITAQGRAQFDAWFQELTDILDENTATHLQAEFERLRVLRIDFSGLELTLNSVTGLYEHTFTDADLFIQGTHMTAAMDPRIAITRETQNNLPDYFDLETATGACTISSPQALSGPITGRIIMIPTEVEVDDYEPSGGGPAASVAETLSYLGIE